MKRLTSVVLLLVGTCAFAQAPATPPTTPHKVVTRVPSASPAGQPTVDFTKDPVFRQLVTQRELLFNKLKDITEFRQFMETERELENYTHIHNIDSNETKK